MRVLASSLTARDLFGAVMGEKRGVSDSMRLDDTVPIWFYGDAKWFRAIVDGDVEGSGHYKETSFAVIESEGISVDEVEAVVTVRRLSQEERMNLRNNNQWVIDAVIEAGKLTLSDGYRCAAYIYDPEDRSRYSLRRECYADSGLPPEEVDYLNKISAHTQILRIDVPVTSSFVVIPKGRPKLS